MAPKVSQAEISKAIQQLTHAIGALTLGIDAIDKEGLSSNEAWAGGEAIRGSITLLEQSYCTLNNPDVEFTVRES